MKQGTQKYEFFRHVQLRFSAETAMGGIRGFWGPVTDVLVHLTSGLEPKEEICNVPICTVLYRTFPDCKRGQLF